MSYPSKNSFGWYTGWKVGNRMQEHKIELLAARIPGVIMEMESGIAKIFDGKNSPQVSTIAFRQYIHHHEKEWSHLLDLADFIKSSVHSPNKLRSLLQGLNGVKATADKAADPIIRNLLYSTRTKKWVEKQISLTGEDLSDLPEGF